jgi:hypothetical protein
MPALAVLGYVNGLASAHINYGGAPGEPIPPEILAEEARLREAFVFPMDLRTLVGGSSFSTLLLWLAVVYIGSAWLGLEHEYRTIRNLALARPGRLGFVLARIGTLLVAVSVMVAALVVLAAVLPAVAGPVGLPDSPRPSLVGAIGYVVATWVALVAVGLGAMLAASLMRSGPGGLIFVIVYAMAEVLLARSPIWNDAGALAWLPQLLPVDRLAGLVGDAAAWAGMVDPFGSTPATGPTPPPVVGAIIALAWVGLIVGALLWRVRRMDITE